MHTSNSLNTLTADAEILIVPTDPGSRHFDEYYREKLNRKSVPYLRLSRNIHHALIEFFIKSKKFPSITITKLGNGWEITFKLEQRCIIMQGQYLAPLLCEATLKIQEFEP